MSKRRRVTEQLGEVLLCSEEHQLVILDLIGAVVNFHLVHGIALEPLPA